MQFRTGTFVTAEPCGTTRMHTHTHARMHAHTHTKRKKSFGKSYVYCVVLLFLWWWSSSSCWYDVLYDEYARVRAYMLYCKSDELVLELDTVP